MYCWLFMHSSHVTHEQATVARKFSSSRLRLVSQGITYSPPWQKTFLPSFIIMNGLLYGPSFFRARKCITTLSPGRLVLLGKRLAKFLIPCVLDPASPVKC